ncbi:hypothetical protein BGZ79_007389 [Entomortierella chlamydospora]|nr:hypothetical protein BGZ79_007389 [Entomortierella chlamydospora]
MSYPNTRKRKSMVNAGNETSATNVIDPNLPGAEYFLSLSDPEELSAPRYVASRIAASPTIDCLTIVAEWNHWMQYLKTCESASWNAAAFQAPTINNSGSPLPLPMLSPPTAGSSEALLSSIVPTAGLFDFIKSEYLAKFDEFTGAPWVLPRGTNVDDILFRYTMTLCVESSLHSFVIDKPDTLIDLFEEDDQRMFQGDIDRDVFHEAEISLTEWKKRDIMRFSLSLDRTRDLIRYGLNSLFADQEDPLSAVDKSELDEFRLRIYSIMLELGDIYKKYDNELPEFRVRSWLSKDVCDVLLPLLGYRSEWLHWIEFEPGSISGSSSSNLEAKEPEDAGLDSIITCKKLQSQCGIAAIKIEGVGYDLRGIRTLRDMFERVCSMCSSPGVMKTQLRVYGIFFSGLRVEIVSLKYVAGRFYRLTREKTLPIPITWDDQSVKAILALIEEILTLQNRVESMAKIVCSHVDMERVLSELSDSTRPIIRHPPTDSTSDNSSTHSLQCS